MTYQKALIQFIGLKEFQKFIARGNVIDLAVGVIIGAAFGKIVDALVNDLIMPILGIAGKADFSNYYIPLASGVTATNLYGLAEIIGPGVAQV